MLHTSLRPPARPMVGGRKVDKERFLRGGYCIAYMIKDTYYAGGARGGWSDQPNKQAPKQYFTQTNTSFNLLQISDPPTVPLLVLLLHSSTSLAT